MIARRRNGRIAGYETISATQPIGKNQPIENRIRDRVKYRYLGEKEMSSPIETQLLSTITCPECGHEESEIMPIDACQFFMITKAVACC